MLLKVDVLNALYKKCPTIRAEYEKALIDDARECGLDFEDMEAFVKESIFNPDMFECFMPQYIDQLNKLAETL